MNRLKGKIAVITGGNSGVGAATAKLFAAEGATVVITARREAALKEVADEITAAGGEVYAVSTDISKPEDPEMLMQKVMDKYGKIDILVNNAGLGGGGRENPFKIDLTYVERVYRMNVFVPWRLCQLAVPEMGKSGYGSIINITSIGSINREANMGIYSSSKAALNHLAANLAYDFGPYGVRINNVGPGATRTAALASVLTPEMQARMLGNTPIHRLGEVSDIAQAVLFLASPASLWISGQVLFVNGGGLQTIS